MRLCHVRPLPTGCLKHCEGVGLGQPRAPHPPERPLLVGSCPLLPMQARDHAMFRLKQKTKNHTRRDPIWPFLGIPPVLDVSWLRLDAERARRLVGCGAGSLCSDMCAVASAKCSGQQGGQRPCRVLMFNLPSR